MRITEIITKVNCKYGAPIGRANIGNEPPTITTGKHCKIYKKNQIKVYDKRVPMNGAYDIGGAYWGLGSQLRIRFTKDLKFIKFYRVDNKPF